MHAQGTAFTYQGRLDSSGSAVSGSYDLQFLLYTTNATGSPVAGPVTNSAVAVSNGLFTTTVDFGPGVFTGTNDWLAIGVRTNGSGGFTPLTPRQQVTPTPYALFAPNAGVAVTAGAVSGTVAAAQLTGTIPSAQLGGNYSAPVSFLNGGNSFAGNGGGLTNISLTGVGPAGTFSIVPLYFGPQLTSIPYTTDWMVLADVNGDGKPDLIVRTNLPGGPPFLAGFVVLTNAGNGNFVTASVNIDGNTSIYLLFKPVVADFNQDGKMDVAILDASSVILYKGNGDGTFTSVSTNNAPGSGNNGIAAADLNPPIYNGYPSIIYVSGSSSTLTPLYNHADGSFGFSLGTAVSINTSPSGRIILSDINGDGLPDLTYFASAGMVTLTNRNGLFIPAATNSAGIGANGSVIGDVNGDGRPDVVTVNPSRNNIVILTNAGGGIFVSNAAVTVGKTPVSIAAITNSAGMITYLATANGVDQTVTVLANDGHGNFTVIGTGKMGLPANSPDDLAMADLNGDGNPDLLLADDPASNNGNIMEAFTFSQVVSMTNPITLSSGANIINGYFSGNFSGNGSGLTSLNASQITSGTLPDARLSGNVPLLGGNQAFSGVNTFGSTANSFNGSFIGSASINSFIGKASGLTGLNASQLASGTVPLAAIPTPTVVTNNASGVTLSGVFNGNGGGLTNTLTAGNFVYAYDTTTQSTLTANTFQDVTFSSNGQVNGWTHTVGTAVFTCGQTGIYLVQYSAETETTTGAATDSLRAVLNGTEIPGSQSATGISAAGTPAVAAKSVLVMANASDSLKIQFTATTTSGALVINNGTGTARPSAALTIIRIQ